METLSDLKKYILREGTIHGNNSCLWADSFAHEVIAEKLRLHILLVDMERAKDAWPYRTLCVSKGKQPLRYVVLLRESIGHFRPLVWVKGNEGVKGGGGSGGGKKKGKGNAKTKRIMSFTFAEEERKDYPDVVKVLFELEKLRGNDAGAFEEAGEKHAEEINESAEEDGEKKE